MYINIATTKIYKFKLKICVALQIKGYTKTITKSKNANIWREEKKNKKKCKCNLKKNLFKNVFSFLLHKLLQRGLGNKECLDNKITYKTEKKNIQQ